MVELREDLNMVYSSPTGVKPGYGDSLFCLALGLYADNVAFIIVYARIRGAFVALGLSVESNETDELVDLVREATRSMLSGLRFIITTSLSR